MIYVDEPRGLVWDIENSAFTVDVWSLYQADAIYVHGYQQVLTVAWHWIGEEKRNWRTGKMEPVIHVKGQDDFPDWDGTNKDYSLVKFIRDELLDKCHFAVAHNGDRHDIQILNHRMIVNKIDPPSPYRQLDTLKMAKRVHGNKAGSNTLKSLSSQHGHSQKGDSGGYDTWRLFFTDAKYRKKMKQYNKQDIPPLLDEYMIYRPWDKQNYPMNLATGNLDKCPKCGIGAMKPKNSPYFTKTGFKQPVQCQNPKCMGWSNVRVINQLKPDFV